jgi:hypothetical protein
MKIRATPLFFLLLGIVGCSKKEDPTPDPGPNTASYVVDGRAMKVGVAQAYFQGPGNAGTDDRLTIKLYTSITGPGVGTETVTLIFNKLPGTAESTYQVQLLHLTQGLGQVYYFYTTNVAATVKKTSSGGYSGAFSGVSPATTAYASSTLTQGVFTDVRL